jgi:hypothetical protein
MERGAREVFLLAHASIFCHLEKFPAVLTARQPADKFPNFFNENLKIASKKTSLAPAPPALTPPQNSP